MSNFSKIVDEIVAEMGDSPISINSGRCDEFAEEFAERVGGEVMVDDYISHYFVKYNGRYYDSETPNGVTNYHDLPAAQRSFAWYNEYDRKHKR